MDSCPCCWGALTGCAVAGIVYGIGGVNLFREMPAAALASSLWKLGDGSIFAVPALSLPKVSWAAVIGIMPIAIATIPESTAHMYQLGHLRKRPRQEKRQDDEVQSGGHAGP